MNRNKNSWTILSVMLSITLFVGCNGESQGPTEITNTPVPPTETPLPPTETPIPPTATVTPIPPTPTNIPADQGPITIGGYEIQLSKAEIEEGVKITAQTKVVKRSGGTIFLPMTPDPKVGTLLITLKFITGDRESFYEYGFQFIDQDGNLFEIDTIFDYETIIIWAVPVLPSSISFMVLCPDGEVIDLAPIMK